MGRKSVDPLDKHIGMRLRAIRQAKNRSLSEAGELIDVSPQQISRVELGQQKLSATQLYRLGRGFGVPVNWFYNEYEEQAEELARLKLIMDEDPTAWEAGEESDEEKTLLTTWRLIAGSETRKALRKLMETIAFK